MTVLSQSQFMSDLKNRGYIFNVLYDIGASIGRWTIEVQKIFPDAKFELFEPLLGKVEGVNEICLTNTRWHPVVLSDITGLNKLRILDRSGVGSSIIIPPSDMKRDFTNIITCDSWRLDDLVSNKKLLQPDFIKIDTQASELKVLQGADKTIRETKFILLETWARRVYGEETPLFHEIAAYLYNNNFVLYDILIEEGRDRDGTLRWFDAAFINKKYSKFPHML